MKATVTLQCPDRVNPFYDRPTQRSFRAVLRSFVGLLAQIAEGFGIPRRAVDSGKNVIPTNIEYSTAYAQAVVTSAAPADGATVTLNGTAMTGHQHRASGTITCASVSDADTVTVGGVVLTAKTSPSGNYQWARGVSDTADAAALAACINNLTGLTQDAASTGIQGLIESKSAAAIVTVYAVAEGTAGNAYTLVSSNGGRLAVSGATLANGAAATNNEFDRIGNDKRTARSFVTNLGLSSSAILSDHFQAACKTAVVTLVNAAVGDWVRVGQTKLFATADATDLTVGGARTTTVRDDLWSQANSDTNDAISLCNCINNHPRLKDKYFADSSAGVVTIHERPPESTTAPEIQTSSGTTLAITGSATVFLDSAAILIQNKRPGVEGNGKTIASSSGVTLAITGSLSRLAGGTSTTTVVQAP